MSKPADLKKRRDELSAELVRAERNVEDLRARIQTVDELLLAPFLEGEDSKTPRPAETERMLFNLLISLRRKLARGTGTYHVFNDETLREIVQKAPLDELALYKIRGISAERLRAYGDKIISCIIKVVDPVSHFRSDRSSPDA